MVNMPAEKPSLSVSNSAATGGVGLNARISRTREDRLNTYERRLAHGVGGAYSGPWSLIALTKGEPVGEHLVAATFFDGR